MQAVQGDAARQAAISRTHDPRPLNNEIKRGLPLFAYYGTYDTIVSGRHLEEEIQCHGGKMEVKVQKDASHSLYWEEPEETAALIADFARKVWKKVSFSIPL